MLPVDEVVDHAALNRAGPVQRVQRRQILNPRRLIAPQDVPHSVRLKLKNRRRIAARKQLVSLCVIQRQIVYFHFDAAVLLHHPHRIMQYGQSRQPQEIHLQQADPFQRIHIELRRNFVAVGLVDRHQVGQRLR